MLKFGSDSSVWQQEGPAYTLHGASNPDPEHQIATWWDEDRHRLAHAIHTVGRDRKELCFGWLSMGAS